MEIVVCGLIGSCQFVSWFCCCGCFWRGYAYEFFLSKGFLLYMFLYYYFIESNTLYVVFIRVCYAYSSDT